MENKILVQVFKNKNNKQMSMAILKRKTSDDILEKIGNKDFRFLELNISKFIK